MAHRSSTTRVRTTAGSCRRHAAAVHAVDSALSAAARLLPLSRCGVFRSPRRPATPLHSATGLPPAARASPRPRGGRPRLHGDGSRRKLAPTSLHPLRLPRPPNPLLRPDRPSKRCAARRLNASGRRRARACACAPRPAAASTLPQHEQQAACSDGNGSGGDAEIWQQQHAQAAAFRYAYLTGWMVFFLPASVAPILTCGGSGRAAERVEGRALFFRACAPRSVGGADHERPLCQKKKEKKIPPEKYL